MNTRVNLCQKPVPPQLRASVIAGVRWNAIGTAVLVGLQALQLVVLSRMLPPGDFGLMSMCLVVIAFAESLSAAGTGNYLIHRQSASPELLATSTATNVMMGLVVALAITLGAPLLAGAFNEPRLVPVVRILACATFLSSIGVIPEQILRRDFRFRELMRSQVMAMTLATAVSITMAAAGFGVLSLVIGFVTRSTTVTALVTWATWRDMNLSRTRQVTQGELRLLFRFGAPQLSERLLGVASERMDLAIIGATMGADMLGYYAFALSLVTIPQTRLNAIVTAVALPAFSKLQHERAILGTAFCKVMRAVTTVNAPILLGLVPLAPVAIPMVFGEQWVPAVPVVQLLAFVGLSRAIGNPVGSLLVATGAVWRGFAWSVGCLAVTLIAVLAGCMLDGTPSGVALCVASIQLLLLPATYLLLVRPTSGASWRQYADSIARPVIAAAIATTIAWSPAIAFDGGTGLAAIQVVLFVAAYPIALRVIDPDSLRELVPLLRRRLPNGATNGFPRHEQGA